jgi:hypothetical protein
LSEEGKQSDYLQQPQGKQGLKVQPKVQSKPVDEDEFADTDVTDLLG